MKIKIFCLFITLAAVVSFLWVVMPVTAQGTPPIVSTINATNITNTSATLNGSLVSLGSYYCANVSFIWGITSSSLTKETTPEVMTSTGNFTANLSDLSPSTTYYYQAKALTDNTSAYGDVVSFTTKVTVSVDAPNEVTPGDIFTAAINISQVEDFDACNYDVSFDSTVLSLDNVTDGNIGGIAAPVNYWNLISPGTFRILQNVPGFPGVDGSGYLAVLHFHVLGFGQGSNITLSNGILGNNEAQAIPATWVGDSVRLGPDITPPTVMATSPSGNATGVTIYPTIEVIFSESMNTTSAQDAFSIVPAVSGNFSWSSSSSVMTFAPVSNLEINKTYTVTIGTGARDLAGNPIAQSYSWSFTTVPTVPGDVTPPRVIATSPAANTTGAVIDTAIIVAFSEAMNKNLQLCVKASLVTVLFLAKIYKIKIGRQLR